MLGASSPPRHPLKDGTPESRLKQAGGGRAACSAGTSGDAAREKAVRRRVWSSGEAVFH